MKKKSFRKSISFDIRAEPPTWVYNQLIHPKINMKTTKWWERSVIKILQMSRHSIHISFNDGVILHNDCISMHRPRVLKSKRCKQSNWRLNRKRYFYYPIWLQWIKAGNPRKLWLQSVRLSVRGNRSGFYGCILTNITVPWIATRHHKLYIHFFVWLCGTSLIS